MTNLCPFCTLPTDRLTWQSDLVLAIRDGYPVSPGHTLVIPRRHVATWFDASPWEQQEIWRAIAELKTQLDADLSPDGYNIGINAGAAAGQTVMHLHVHLIPRFAGDMDDPRGGVRGVIPSKQKYGDAPAPSPTGDPGPFTNLRTFVPGPDHPLGGILKQALQVATEADWVSAFVQTSGLDELEEHIHDAASRGVQFRLLTGDYNNFTSHQALTRLLNLEQQLPTFRARFYRVQGDESFHAKAYIFAKGPHGVAWVGSSNLSEQALGSGIEWNLRTSSDKGYQQARTQFEQLWTSPQSQRLTAELIAEYARSAPLPKPLGPEPAKPLPIPHPIQEEALRALRRTREDGESRGLVVLATGLGKTFLSAFDFREMEGRRALFVAHREEILKQARNSWALLHPNRTTGLMVGGDRDADADLVFASVQTLTRAAHLRSFAPDHFDYIVVDEFHHAAATTYRRVLAHFEPRFLLGLTATPDRMDGARLRDLCDDNEVFRAGLVEGISRGLLVPFRYHGIRDEVDYSAIPWRSNRFDPDELDHAVATSSRAEQAMREYTKHAPTDVRRTLAFCCSVRHADYMAEFLRGQGIEARAIHSQPTSAPRAPTIEAFRRGEIEVICAVDIFNEGVDLPDVNTILMLRPTQSITIFLQQLGRGLRRSTNIDKPHLTVVDFIGNHRSFLVKPQALLALTGKSDVPAGAATRAIREGKLDLPEGCSVDIETDVIDMLEAVSRLSKKDTLLYEYLSLRDTHGRRPTAGEVFTAGVHLKPVKDHYDTWFDFVDQQGDLDELERAVVDRYRPWFKDLLRTQMSRSYKMVALRVLLDDEHLHDGMDVDTLAERCRRFLEHDLILRQELDEHREAGGTHADFVARWRKMPLQIFHAAKGFSRRWFVLDGDRFDADLGVAESDRDVFDALTEEMIDLRLRQTRSKLRNSNTLLSIRAPIRMRVSHNSGGPILRFDREKRPDIPQGDTRVWIGDTPHWFRFVKIAVNKAFEEANGPNTLPRILREWFGPHAGLPGTRHEVDLRYVGDRWQLRPDIPTAQDPGGDLLPFPALPYYPELAVACGPAAAQYHGQEVHQRIRVDPTHDVHAKRHFVVRATGDSMNGGHAPIRDGDLVLCEWMSATRPEEVEGRPCLLAGWEGDDQSFAQLKVPVRVDGAWVLRSWNPEFADIPVEPGTTLQVAGRVIGPVKEATGPTLWGLYTRDEAVSAFGQSNNQSWQVGHRDFESHGQPHTVLFVTLRKGPQTPAEHRYADRFLMPDQFQWESQDKTTPESTKGQRILGHAEEGRRIHLFARYEAKLKGKGERFLYCGCVHYQRHEGSAPIRVWFGLEHALPERVFRLWSD